MNYSTPWSSYLHGIWPTPPKGFATWMGSGAEGFKYQVPWAQFAPSAPFSGNPFQQTSPMGPYKQTVFGLKGDQQSAMLNYTQFGPSPFGPYGVNNRYSRQWGSIPSGVVPGAMGSPMGAGMGGGGPAPFHHSGLFLSARVVTHHQKAGKDMCHLAAANYTPHKPRHELVTKMVSPSRNPSSSASAAW